MDFIVSAGDSFLFIRYMDSIDQFIGNVPLKNLEYQLMTSDMEQSLRERGAKYAKWSTKPHYFAYDNESFSIHKQKPQLNNGYNTFNQPPQGIQATSTFLRTRGRVMLDTDTARRLGHYAGERSSQGMALIQNTQQYHQQKLNQQQIGKASRRQNIQFGMMNAQTTAMQEYVISFD